jgi:hypothetical protein
VIVRTFVTVLYLIAVVTALALQFFVPVLGAYLLYGLLGWFMLSFFLYRMPVMSRRLFGRSGPTASATPVRPVVGIPLASNPEGTPLGFCAYCATAVEPGTPVCPACGHAIPVF